MVLSWNAAAATALALAVVAMVRRVPRGVAAVAREAALVFALYGLWQLAGTLSVMHVDGAVGRGTWLWHIERFLPLPSELTVQRWALPHPLLVEACNVYYAVVHGPALIVFLVWLFARHRHRYPAWRNTIVLLTGASLAMQLIPVAPPRLLPHLGFVDTGLQYHQSVYGAIGRGMADQLSAMPSVHVGWAVLIALAVIRTSTSPRRWLVLLHPLLTVVAVVVTGNHFWLDGIVSVLLLAGALGLQRAARAALATADRAAWPSWRRTQLAR
jgi:PAP2 superfamily